MKLLMITRKVDRNDHLAGFIYTWVKAFAGNIEELNVICLESGDVFGLPKNVRVYGLNTKNKIVKFFKFQKLVLQFVPKSDGVFCHMNPEYTVAVAPVAKLYRKKIVSWYMHKAITFKMRLMEKLADVVLSASKESFRLPSKKLVITGHGIDVDTFIPKKRERKNKNFSLLSLGRISPTKDIESIIKAVDILKKENIEVELKIIGAPGLTSQKQYFKSLQEFVKNASLQNNIQFVGAVPNKDVLTFYQNSDVFVNMSGTGSVDKVVLEAMSCECLVSTSNEAFKNIVGKDFMVEKNSPKDLARKILELRNMDEMKKYKILKKFRKEVVENHNLKNLAKKIIKQF